MSRSSRREVFCRKDVLRNFANFTWKHLYQSLFFNKVPGLSLFFKKETLAQVFFRKFCDIFKSTCFNRTSLLAASVCPVKLYPKRYSFKLQVIKFANLIQSLMQFIFSLWGKKRILILHFSTTYRCLFQRNFKWHCMSLYEFEFRIHVLTFSLISHNSILKNKSECTLIYFGSFNTHCFKNVTHPYSRSAKSKVLQYYIFTSTAIL